MALMPCLFLLGACQTTSADITSQPSNDLDVSVLESNETESDKAVYLNSSNDPILIAGQILEITVMGEDDLSGTYQISADGDIVFPLIGNVMVQGQTPAQLKDLITAQLQDGYIKNPFVQVFLKNNAAFISEDLNDG